MCRAECIVTEVKMQLILEMNWGLYRIMFRSIYTHTMRIDSKCAPDSSVCTALDGDRQALTLPYSAVLTQNRSSRSESKHVQMLDLPSVPSFGSRSQ